KAAASWTKRSGRRARRGRDSTRTRTTNRGGFRANEGVLPVAGGRGGDRWGGPVVRLAAHVGVSTERARPGRGGGRVPRLHCGVGRGADRDHGVFGLRVSALRVVRGGADGCEPRSPVRSGPR